MSIGLATIELGGPSLAVWADGYVLPLAAARKRGSEPPPSSLQAALASWERWSEVAQAVAAGGRDERWHAADDVAFLPAVPEPPTIYCAGANYYDHAREMGHESPDKSQLRPYHFIASRAALAGHRSRVARPDGCERFDWEVELAVVIGRAASRVRAEEALNVIAGYTVANDLSCRDFAKRVDVPFSPDWVRSKCYEGCLPLGPAVVPASAVADPMKLELTLTVNGEPRQESNTSEMIFSIAEQIEYLSAVAPLHPGDVLITGTPAGTGAAWGRYLEPGDEVRAHVACLGALQVSIVGAC